MKFEIFSKQVHGMLPSASPNTFHNRLLTISPFVCFSKRPSSFAASLPINRAPNCTSHERDHPVPGWNWHLGYYQAVSSDVVAILSEADPRVGQRWPEQRRAGLEEFLKQTVHCPCPAFLASPYLRSTSCHPSPLQIRHPALPFRSCPPRYPAKDTCWCFEQQIC